MRKKGTSRSGSEKCPSPDREVLETAHALATALHRVGAMDEMTMRDIDRLCLPERPEYGAAEIKRIRAATRMSQPLFARLLGVEKSAVAQWEQGMKRPSGPALRLLEILDPQKPENPVLDVRREIVGGAAG